jgi:Fur family ferric uptake transcriptional regulator
MTRENVNLETALHASEHRVTGQRRVLLEIIRSRGEHLDAEELHRLARKRYPRMSLSTVYRTLGLLRDLGLVDEVHLGEDHHHYEIKPGAAHHHLICLCCGQVQEFSSPLAERLTAAAAREHNFEVHSVEIDLIGLCARCRKAATGITG